MKLIDTSVWIRFFNAGEPTTKNADLRELIRNGEAAFCDLVRLELQSRRQTETRAIELLVATPPVLEHSPEVWDRAYHIARNAENSESPCQTQTSSYTPPPKSITAQSCTRTCTLTCLLK